MSKHCFLDDILEERLYVIQPEGFVNPKDAKEYLELYESFPAYLVNLLDDIMFLGEAEIYSKIQNYSPKTLVFLDRVLSLCKENKITVPDIEIFKTSSIEESRGWGNNQTRNYWLK